MTKRERPTKAMSKDEAQRLRAARAYDAIAKFCKLPRGIDSMTISTGRRSVTIDKENSPRMVRNARAIAEALRPEPPK